MQPLIITTLVSTAALTAAAPHALNHFKLHRRALDVETRAVELTPLAGRSVVTTENFKPPYDLTTRDVDLSISPTGQCGGSSGFQCAPGFCCSQYGYCGKGPKYCGGGGASSAAPAYSAPPSYSSPAQSSAAAPSQSWAPSSAAAPSGSSAPAPSSYAPAPSSAAAPSGSSSPSSYAPAPSSSGSSGGGGYGNTYKMYSGDGSPSQGWPSTSDWMDFEGLWEANLPLLQASCSQFGQADNSPQENDNLKAAIQSAASQYNIDERFILSVVMQESKGCVRVWTTDNGVTNPGLMQSHDGQGSCNSDSDGVMDPCPPEEIQLMIKDGVDGTTAGDGLHRIMPQCTGSDEAQRYYQAGTIYNSGSLPQNLDDNTATACYASDIANRLTGWTDAPTSCNL